MNILSPPAEVVFGKWNDRLLKESEAIKLSKEMQRTKFAPFARGNLLPLIISKEQVGESCLQKAPNVENAPIFELTEQATSSGMKLFFAGGRHRKRATEILQANSLKQITDLEERITQLKESSKKVPESKLRHLEALLEEEKAVSERIGIWGIIVYDEGEESSL